MVKLKKYKYVHPFHLECKRCHATNKNKTGKVKRTAYGNAWCWNCGRFI